MPLEGDADVFPNGSIMEILGYTRLEISVDIEKGLLAKSQSLSSDFERGHRSFSGLFLIGGFVGCLPKWTDMRMRKIFYILPGTVSSCGQICTEQHALLFMGPHSTVCAR